MFSRRPSPISNATVCYAIKAQFQPGGDCHAGAARCRGRRGFGRRVAPRAAGRRSVQPHRLFRRRQDGAGDGLRAVGRASSASTSNRNRTSNSCPSARWRPARRHPSRCASIRMWMPAPTTRSPPARRRNKFGIPWNRAREVYARAAMLPGIQVCGNRHAYRQPDHRS